ncbi:MAG: hypothetical protein HYR76_02585 [Ignavibacteria bacterium]|nr:hypothetical protein [Ignavibacteria bacterium]
MKNILWITSFLVLAFILASCQSDEKGVAITANGDFWGAEGSTLYKYLPQATALRNKIRNHQATEKDMKLFLEELMKKEDITKDPNALAIVEARYALSLEIEHQFDNAEAIALKAKDIVLHSNSEQKRFRLASIDNTLAKIYLDQPNYEKLEPTLKRIVIDFQDVSTPDGKSKEIYASMAVKLLGLLYRKTNRFGEGIDYLTTIVQRYPDSRTRVAALAQVYDLQMSRGETDVAASTRQILEEELKKHPDQDYQVASDRVLDKWKAIKENAAAPPKN